MLRWAAACAVLVLAALTLAGTSVAGIPVPATATTITLQPSGAVHIEAIQMVADSEDGVTEYHFDLQKMYGPENVSVYDFATGRPLKYDATERGDVIMYDVHFDRPYYDGYIFVAEYDCHRRIIYEGSGVYSFGMRTVADARRYERTFTILLPMSNFTYLGYNTALDHPVKETDDGVHVKVVFHNVSEAGSDYAWEVRFGATGIDDEVRHLNNPYYTLPVPGMSVTAAIAALLICAMSRKR